MNKNYNAFKIITEIYKQTLKNVPYSSALTFGNYIIAGAMPGVATFTMTKLFDSAYRLTLGEAVSKDLLYYGFLYLITYLINDLFYFISSITINAGIYEKCKNYYRLKLGEKAGRLPLIAFEDVDILNKQIRAQDCINREILPQIFMQCIVFTTSAVSVISVITLLARYSLWFILISLFSVLPYFIARVIRGKEFYHVKAGQAKQSRRMNYLWGLFNNKQTMKEMRVMGFDGYITDRWREARDDVNEEIWAFNKKDNKTLLLCDGIRIAGYAASIVFSLVLTLKGNITIGLLGACIAAFQTMQEQTKVFLIDFGRMPEQLSFASDYFSFLDLEEETDGGISFSGLHDDITLEKLCFRYPNSDEFAVNNVSFKIKKGEKIAVLGENGSGKTTLSKLILGLYPAYSGRVLYDKTEVTAFERESLHKKISAISQNFTKYNLTLRENIAISDTSRLDDDDSITVEIKDSGLDILLHRQSGLEMELGREFGGEELSGGQWQKLAIARGLFKESEIIILDEPTSALDPLIETEILSKFIEIANNKTAVIISHRVGLCKLVDRIIVMKNGQIAETGTHGELMKQRGEYFRLYTSQEKWYRSAV